MRESRKAIKAEFVKNQSGPSEGPHFEALLGMVDEAVDMMRHGIMRGELNPKSGNYGTSKLDLLVLNGCRTGTQSCSS